MRVKLCLAVLLVQVLNAHAANTPHWSYVGESGPSHWGDLSPAFAKCSQGQQQSPVDIRHTQKGRLQPLDFRYLSSASAIINTGHTVQVNLTNGGMLMLDSTPFKLVQFHFHTPSEERFHGKTYPMDIHLVHKNADGDLAVVAIPLKQGRANVALKPIFEDLPLTEGASTVLQGLFNPNDILPKDRGYYSLIGSLTTPPCSEGVRWKIMKQPIEVSKEQIAAFRKLYTSNARPVQPLNHRQLEED